MDVHGELTLPPAEPRSSLGAVVDCHNALCRHFVAQTIDAIPVIVLVLDENRQIVLANAQALHALKSRMDELLGKRPGEAFRCVHAEGSPHGCGTTEFCTRCGAIRSLMAGLEGIKAIQECNLTRVGTHGVEALDLQVSSSPVEIEGRRYVLFCVQDTSDGKRRRILERLFFHDMLNTAGGLCGLMDILRQEVPEHLRDDANFIHTSLTWLVDELLGQRDLTAAENDELSPSFSCVRSSRVLSAAARMGVSLGAASGKSVTADPDSTDLDFVTDPGLLGRVLGNMVKNALEATPGGGVVSLGCTRQGDMLRFWVRNPGCMSDDVRLKIFKRSFSTKGKGRGLGTYGMKLLGERYLCGRVGFETDPENGTTFHILLPVDPTDVNRPGATDPSQ